MITTSTNDIECPGCDKNTWNIPGKKTEKLKSKKISKRKQALDWNRPIKITVLKLSDTTLR